MLPSLTRRTPSQAGDSVPTSYRALQTLLDLGANPNILDTLEQMSPLMHAIRNRDHKAVRILVGHPSTDLELPGEMGYHALHYAAYYAAERCISILRRAGASLTAKTENGHTPAEIAEANVDDPMVLLRVLRGLGVVRCRAAEGCLLAVCGLRGASGAFSPPPAQKPPKQQQAPKQRKPRVAKPRVAPLQKQQATDSRNVVVRTAAQQAKFDLRFAIVDFMSLPVKHTATQILRHTDVLKLHEQRYKVCLRPLVALTRT